MSLVGVEHVRVDAERVERADAADTEEDLLAQPVLGVAAVQAVGHVAHVVGVLVDIGVEQVQRHAPDIGAPHPRVQRGAGQVDGDADVVAVGDRHRVRVEVGIALLLPPVGVEGLPEVAVPVEEPDADERDAEVARCLQVVAGQHAEAARVLRERLGDAVLGREVRHEAQRRAGLARGAQLEPAVAVEVALVLLAHLAEEPHEAGVLAELGEAVAAHEPEQAHRIVHRRVPCVGVDPAEQVAGLAVPRPPQVHRQLLEGDELLGERWPDREAAQRLHRRPTLDRGATTTFPLMHEVRGVVALEKGKPVSVETIVVPDPGPGEVVVDVAACGVCHTDLHYREGAINDDFPFLLGHEAAGRVSEVGEGVTDVAVGDFVILNWRAVCGQCRACLRGRPWYCFATHNAAQKMTLAPTGASCRPHSASARSRTRRSSPRARRPRSTSAPGPRPRASSAAA